MAKEFTDFLVKRGYDPGTVGNAFVKVGKLDRANLLLPSNRRMVDKAFVPFVYPFSGNEKEVVGILKVAGLTIAIDPQVAPLFHIPQRFVPRLGANLKKRLVRAAWLRPEKVRWGCAPCGGGSCLACIIVERATSFSSVVTGKKV